MEAENKELKSRIERQETFQKRRIEKEKKEKRSRSGLRGAIGGSSGERREARGRHQGGGGRGCR